MKLKGQPRHVAGIYFYSRRTGSFRAEVDANFPGGGWAWACCFANDPALRRIGQAIEFWRRGAEFGRDIASRRPQKL